MSENSRTLSPKAFETPAAAASRTARSGSERRFSAAETVISSTRPRPSPGRSTGTRRCATVSSKRRFQADRPVTSFSCSSFSASSESWCGRNTRRSRSQGRQRASAGEPAIRPSSSASSRRFSSSVKNSRWLPMTVTRSCMVW